MVIRSQPASRRSTSVELISARSSPRPKIRLDLVTSPRSRASVDDLERPLIAEAGADRLEDARHRLQVVREDLGLRVEDLREQFGPGVEIRGQQLDAAAGHRRVDLAHRLRVQPRALVVEIVAGDAGDSGVAKPHRRQPTRRRGAARRGRAARDDRCRSGRTNSSASRLRRRSGTSLRGLPSTRRCSGSPPLRIPCATPRFARGPSTRCTPDPSGRAS